MASNVGATTSGANGSEPAAAVGATVPTSSMRPKLAPRAS